MGLGEREEEKEEEEEGGGRGEYGQSFGDDNDNNNNNNREACSICLEAVVTDNNGDRSWATLHCGHQFHLDCIGSAFNIKGAMQCPNCRKIEKGQWLYASVHRSLPEFSMDDWAHEDLYDLSYSEMSFGVRWCPFGSLPRFHPSFEEGEFSSNTYHELFGQHAIFAEHTAAMSSASHPCPYVTYLGPFHHPSSSNSSGSISDVSSFGSHWNGPSVPSDIPSSYGFPSMDLHYHSWEHHSPPFSTTTSRISSSEHPPVPSTTQRSARSSLDLPRMGSFMHPFLVGHSSSARASSSVASSVSPPYQGSNARNRDRVQALQAYYQQQPGSSPAIRTPIMQGTWRSSSHRGLSQAGSAASSSDHSGFYFVPPVASGQSFQEAENPLPARFHTWERDHLPSFSSSQTDRDAVWGAFRQGAGALDPGIRSYSFRQRHGSERMSSSQNRS